MIQDQEKLMPTRKTNPRPAVCIYTARTAQPHRLPPTCQPDHQHLWSGAVEQSRAGICTTKTTRTGQRSQWRREQIGRAHV